MNSWQDTGKETEPDNRNRVQLGASIKTPPGVRYRVKRNELGQILLDPVKLVPAYEAWFHENQERVAAYQLSVAQAEAGQTASIDLGPAEDE
jgi:hypothetical protein